jgi:hypothetical protein
MSGEELGALPPPQEGTEIPEEEFDANATLPPISTPPKINDDAPSTMAENSPIEANKSITTEEVTMQSLKINLDPFTLTAKDIELHTLKQPNEHHAKTLFEFVEKLIHARDENWHNCMTLVQEKETLRLDLKKAQDQRDQNWIDLTQTQEELVSALENQKAPETKVAANFANNSSLLHFPQLLKTHENDYMSKLEIKDEDAEDDYYETSRELKANERINILKALAATNRRVTDQASLRQYLQDLSNKFKMAGLYSISDVCAQDMDPTKLIERFETKWQNNPKKAEAIKSQDQEGIVLFETLREKFAFNSIVRSKLELIEKNGKIPNKLKGIAALCKIKEEYGHCNMETIIKATVKLMLSSMSAGNKRIQDYNTFEDWHLAANKDQDEYMKMYGMVNFSIIKLANTYLAMRGIGKYGQFLALHRLTWPQTLPEILLNAEVLTNDLVQACIKWDSGLDKNTRRGYRDPSTRLQAKDMLTFILDDAKVDNVSLHITPMKDCTYCGQKSHERRDCANLKNDLSLQHKVSALIPPVSTLVAVIKSTRKILQDTNIHKQTAELKKFNDNMVTFENKLAPLLIGKTRIGTHSENSTTRPPLPYGSKGKQEKTNGNKGQEKKNEQRPGTRSPKTHVVNQQKPAPKDAASTKQKKEQKKFTRFIDFTDDDEDDDAKFFRNKTYLTFDQEEEEELDMVPPHDANEEDIDPDVSLLVTDETMELESLREMISSRAPTPEVPDNWETLAEDEDTMPYHPMYAIAPQDLFTTTTAELHLNPSSQLTPISPWSQTQLSEISEAYQLHLITPENYTMLSEAITAIARGNGLGQPKDEIKESTSRDLDLQHFQNCKPHIWWKLMIAVVDSTKQVILDNPVRHNCLYASLLQSQQITDGDFKSLTLGKCSGNNDDLSQASETMRQKACTYLQEMYEVSRSAIKTLSGNTTLNTLLKDIEPGQMNAYIVHMRKHTSSTGRLEALIMSTMLQRNIAFLQDTYNGNVHYTDYFTPTGAYPPPEKALPNDINLLLKDEHYYVIIDPGSVVYPEWNTLPETMPKVHSMMHLKPNRGTSPTHTSKLVMNTIHRIDRAYCTSLGDNWEGIPDLIASSSSEYDSDEEHDTPTKAPESKAPPVLVEQKPLHRPPNTGTVNDETLNDLPDLVQSSSSEDSEYEDSDGDDNDGFGPAVSRIGNVKFYSLNSLLSSKPIPPANDPVPQKWQDIRDSFLNGIQQTNQKDTKDTSEAGITPPPSDDDDVSLLPTPVKGAQNSNEVKIPKAFMPHGVAKGNGQAIRNEKTKPIMHPFQKTEPSIEQPYIGTQVMNPSAPAGLCAYPPCDKIITYDVHTQDYPFCGLEHAIKGGAVKGVYKWHDTPTHNWNGTRCIPIEVKSEEPWTPIQKEPWPNHTPAFQKEALPIQKNLIQHLRKHNLLETEEKEEDDDTLLALHISRHLNHVSLPPKISTKSGGEQDINNNATMHTAKSESQKHFKIDMSANDLADAFITEIVNDEHHKQLRQEQDERIQRLRHELTKSRKLQKETLKRLRNETVDHSKTMSKLQMARLKSLEADRAMVRETLSTLRYTGKDVNWTINIRFTSRNDAIEILKDLTKLTSDAQGDLDDVRLLKLGIRAERQNLPGCPYYNTRGPPDYVGTTHRLLSKKVTFTTTSDVVKLTGDLSSTGIALSLFLTMIRSRLYEPDTLTWRAKAKHVLTLCIHDGEVGNENLATWPVRDAMGPVALKITDTNTRHDYGVRMNASPGKSIANTISNAQMVSTNTVQRPKRKDKPSPPKPEYGKSYYPTTPPAKRSFY